MSTEDLEIVDDAYDYAGKPMKLDIFELTTDKLVEFHELIQLKAEYPNFENEVAKNLKAFTTNDSLIKRLENATQIMDIKQIGHSITVSDSVQNIKIHFKTLRNDEEKTDSILAIIKSKPIFIDGTELLSRKVSFSDLKSP
ncbi:hypothetical protein [Winogradskyella sp. 3972H.M.0a.05]|uniref:hypothetical protein n=1 Tax=Winogradskyella sp. 3972H.M.0a.05 TaxID=2950277 RepID=UPI00339A0E16